MTTPDQPSAFAPLEARRAAAEAFNAAHARTLDLGQITAAIADAVWGLAVAEGRRQATEGWGREWAVNLGGNWPMHPCDSEADARRLAAYRDGRTVVSRLVGPWEDVEQAEQDAPADIEVVKTRSAGWAFRCHSHDITSTGHDEATALQRAADHVNLEHAEQAGGDRGDR